MVRGVVLCILSLASVVGAAWFCPHPRAATHFYSCATPPRYVIALEEVDEKAEPSPDEEMQRMFNELQGHIESLGKPDTEREKLQQGMIQHIVSRLRLEQEIYAKEEEYTRAVMFGNGASAWGEMMVAKGDLEARLPYPSCLRLRRLPRQHAPNGAGRA